jgi:hypothetical protein
MSWDKGVSGRAYYIVGAHMAQQIQAGRGREALVQTIVEGPYAFATLYNSLVEQDRRVGFEPIAREATRSRQRRERNLIWAACAILVPVLLIVSLIARRRLRVTG